MGKGGRFGWWKPGDLLSRLRRTFHDVYPMIYYISSRLSCIVIGGGGGGTLH